MLHPVGQHPASVYWRRRLVVLAALVLLVVLIALTGNALFGGDSAPAAASDSPTNSPTPSVSRTATASTPRPSTSKAPSTTVKPPSSNKPASTTAATTVATSATPTSTPTMPPDCASAQLKVQAVPKDKSFAVGSKPELMLRATNTGTGPCVQDVSDSKIELRVYNGASRVWGSHDCQIAPGTDPRTMLPNQPATFSITWTGLSSQPGCEGTRQRVGAGTYTLYASLAGKDGTAATFELK